MNFAKFLRTPFLIEHLWWLLLSIVTSVLANYKNLANFTGTPVLEQGCFTRQGRASTFVLLL